MGKYRFTLKLHPRFSNGGIKSKCYQIHIRFDKACKVVDLNSQKDNNLDLDLEKDMRTIMQQCLEPHSNHSKPNGTKRIFKLKDLFRINWAQPKICCWTYTSCEMHQKYNVFIFSFWLTYALILTIWNVGDFNKYHYDRKVLLCYKWKWKENIAQGLETCSP